MKLIKFPVPKGNAYDIIMLAGVGRGRAGYKTRVAYLNGVKIIIYIDRPILKRQEK